MNFDKYKHYIIGENKLCFPDSEYILKLDYPRVYIKYNLKDSLFSDFSDFYKHFTDVQWLDGNPPNDETKNIIFIDAYNFLCLDEILLEQDLKDLDNEKN